MLKVALYLFCLVFLSSKLLADSEWMKRQNNYALKRVQDNISRDDTRIGFVVAATSKSDPNYYFHWVRDAALVMKSLDGYLPWAKKSQLFKNYTEIVLHHQSVNKLTGLGEPKFNPDGTSFKGHWGRPQNDGPALRALTLIDFASELLDHGNSTYVNDKLYRPELPAKTAIKRDLEYVAHHWTNLGFDLWEEVKGHHFYTRLVQRSALKKGARLAGKLKDPDAAAFYESKAAEISRSLEGYWDDSKSYIVTTLGGDPSEGLDYKISNLDASVILGAIHVDDADASFSVVDSRIQSTFFKLVDEFSKLYPVNQKFSGVGIGRYPEDTYYGGNPWFLITHGFAEAILKMVKVYRSQGGLQIDAINKKFFSLFLSDEINIGSISSDDPSFEAVIAKMKSYALTFIERSQKHTAASGQMDEQFHKKSGFMVGAKHLTWSYASYLTLYKAYIDDGTFTDSYGWRSE